MSWPHNFGGQDSARSSPLDRQQSPFTSGQPVSFKTNVNRKKTQRWVEAKQASYDGDDWGDEYDEYDYDPPPMPPAPSGLRQKGQGVGAGEGSRSFTSPVPRDPHQLQRSNSFDAGDEKRAFSTNASLPPQSHPAQDTTSPPPAQPTVSSAKSPPLIRPSDIYKRMEEAREKERRSQDSQRPSLDSINRETTETQEKPAIALPPVQERGIGSEEEVQSAPATSTTKIDHSIASPNSARDAPHSATMTLPEVNFESSFDTDLWSPSKDHAEAQNVTSDSLQHQPSVGLRSAVHQAFDVDSKSDNKSVPPTPISRDANATPAQSDSAVSRSNTDSTSGISPIMSRVPSAATAAAKIRSAENNTPAIAEEPEGRRESQATLGGGGSSFQIKRKPSAAHARNVSSESVKMGYRRDMNPPSSNNSPARSPKVAPKQDLPRPESGELGMISPADIADSSAREADLAFAVNQGLQKDSGQVAKAEEQARDDFTNAHATSPNADLNPPRLDLEADLTGPTGDQDSASLRPKLPGQWESFATAQTGSSMQTATTSSDMDLAPTTSKHPLDYRDGSQVDMTSDTPAPLNTSQKASPVPASRAVFSPNDPHHVEPRLSLDDSDADTESDRLRKEIHRSLTPARSAEDNSVNSRQQSPQRQATDSTLPGEYSSYWAETGNAGSRPVSNLQIDHTSPSEAQPNNLVESPIQSQPPTLQQRYSWEASQVSSVGASPLGEPPVVSPLPSDVNLVSPQSPLHVVNQSSPEPSPIPAVDESSVPEAVDSTAPRPSSDGALQTLEPLAESNVTGIRPISTTQSEPSKPLPSFRQILALKSSSERISSFDETRAQLASMNIGLEAWLTTTLKEHPEHASVLDGSKPPMITTTGLGGTKHKSSPSFSRTNQDANTPQDSSVKSPGFSGGNKVSSKEMQAKGKEFLHTAGVLGGKGMTGAKGLFAKGKSRFRSSGEKARRDSDASIVSSSSRKSHFHFRTSSRPTSLVLFKTPSDFDASFNDTIQDPLTAPASAAKDRRTSHPIATAPWDEPQSFESARRDLGKLAIHDRLGVLPSPASPRETFLLAPSNPSTPGQELDQNMGGLDSAAPPVPEIPQAVLDGHRARMSLQQERRPSAVDDAVSFLDVSDDEPPRQRPAPRKQNTQQSLHPPDNTRHSVWDRRVSETIERAVSPMEASDTGDRLADESWFVMSPEDDHSTQGVPSRASFSEYLNNVPAGVPLGRTSAVRLPSMHMDPFMSRDEWKIFQERSPVDTPDSWDRGSIGIFPPVPADGIASKLAEHEQSTKLPSRLSSVSHVDDKSDDDPVDRLEKIESETATVNTGYLDPRQASRADSHSARGSAVSSLSDDARASVSGEAAGTFLEPNNRTSQSAMSHRSGSRNSAQDSAQSSQDADQSVAPIDISTHAAVTSPTLGRERPLSFEPIPRDSTGGPPQEQLNQANEKSAPSETSQNTTQPAPVHRYRSLLDDSDATSLAKKPMPGHSRNKSQPAQQSQPAQPGYRSLLDQNPDAQLEAPRRPKTPPNRRPSPAQAASYSITPKPTGRRTSHQRSLSSNSQIPQVPVQYATARRDQSFENPRPSPNPMLSPSNSTTSPRSTGFRHRNVMEAAAAGQFQQQHTQQQRPSSSKQSSPNMKSSWSSRGSLEQQQQLPEVKDKRRFRETITGSFRKLSTTYPGGAPLAKPRSNSEGLVSLPENRAVHPLAPENTASKSSRAFGSSLGGGKMKRFSNVFSRSTPDSSRKAKRLEPVEPVPPIQEANKQAQIQQLRTVYHWPQSHTAGRSSGKSQDIMQGPSAPVGGINIAQANIYQSPDPTHSPRLDPSPNLRNSLSPPTHSSFLQKPSPPSPRSSQQFEGLQQEDTGIGAIPPPGGYYAPPLRHKLSKPSVLSPVQERNSMAMGSEPLPPDQIPSSIEKPVQRGNSQYSHTSHQTQSDFDEDLTSPTGYDAVYWNMRSPHGSQSHGPGYASSSALPGSPVDRSAHTSMNGQGFPVRTSSIDASVQAPQSAISTGSFQLPSPGVFTPSVPTPRSHPRRMDSITEAEHQERPWNISLPANQQSEPNSAAATPSTRSRNAEQHLSGYFSSNTGQPPQSTTPSAHSQEGSSSIQNQSQSGTPSENASHASSREPPPLDHASSVSDQPSPPETRQQPPKAQVQHITQQIRMVKPVAIEVTRSGSQTPSTADRSDKQASPPSKRQASVNAPVAPLQVKEVQHVRQTTQLPPKGASPLNRITSVIAPSSSLRSANGSKRPAVNANGRVESRSKLRVQQVEIKKKESSVSSPATGVGTVERSPDVQTKALNDPKPPSYSIPEQQHDNAVQKSGPAPISESTPAPNQTAVPAPQPHKNGVLVGSASIPSSPETNRDDKEVATAENSAELPERRMSVEVEKIVDDSDDEPVMLGVSYPGMEWQPVFDMGVE